MSVTAARHSWIAVLVVAMLLGAGAWALVRYVPPAEGVAVGDRAPDFRLVQLATGDSVDIRRHYAGHVTLVNLWATWCEPCQQEMPSIERLYEAYRARGFRVAAASIDAGDAAPVVAFARRFGLSFDILHDASGRIQQVYQTIGVPQSFLIDARGRISYVSLGAEAWDSPANRQRVERLLTDGS